MTPGARQNIELVRGIYASEPEHSPGDPSSAPLSPLLEVVDPKAVFVADAGEPDEIAYAGVAEIRRWLERAAEDWQNLRYQLSELEEAGKDRVLASGRVRASLRGGATIDLPFANVWTIRRGRIVRGEAYSDRAVARRSLRRGLRHIGSRFRMPEAAEADLSPT
jgi:ketosteroid isomerase-like protein